MTMQAAQAHVNRIVAASGSSFSLGMMFLPAKRRRAMFAVYAFCREVDDIADGPGSSAEKTERLTAWREEIGRIYTGTARDRTAGNPTVLALIHPVETFDLPRRELVAVIDGVEMDARDEMIAPPAARLDQYCRNVAGAVGLLSLHVFGETHAAAERFALTLGHAFQLTNILRDIDEDATANRLYVPRELLLKHGLDPARHPKNLVADPRIAFACEDLARTARQLFNDADALLAQCNRGRLRPALIMFGTYERLLDELETTGWHPPRARVRLNGATKAWASVRRGLFRPKCRPFTS